MSHFIVKKSPETHPLTWRIKENYYHPIWIDDYKKKNGYVAAKKAITYMNPHEIINIIVDSQLSGRGGAGFPTGIKWSTLSKNPKNCIRYLLCNADEMEPGTYKDRFLMENLPHLLIEGIIIASYALGVSKSYIFLRDDYIEPRMYLHQAISEAKDNKLLGKNILNTEFSLEVILHTGAGRYICGEETALINSLEGYRANPRSKPPFPANFGAWGKPTCVNNVETLCNVPAIIENGVEWYKSLSINNSKDQGTKLMGFSGKVKHPGIWEFPFGVLAREIFENYARGMQSNLSLKAWQPGGAGTSFLMKKHLDVPMDFENINKIGSRLGTAMSIAIDNTMNIVSITKNLEEFFSRESCGWCTPCRDGLSWSVKILHNLENKNGKRKDIEMLEELCDFLSPGKTFCAHAQGAAAPLKSALKYFRSEFISGIRR